MGAFHQFKKFGNLVVDITAQGGFCVLGSGKADRSGSDNTINALLSCFGRIPIGGNYLFIVAGSDGDIGLGIQYLMARHKDRILCLTSPQTRLDKYFKSGACVVKCLRDEQRAQSSELLYSRCPNGIEFKVDCPSVVKWLCLYMIIFSVQSSLRIYRSKD